MQLLKLFRLLKPYTFTIICIFALVLLQSLSDLYLPTLMADIVNKGVIPGDTDYIWRYGGYMLLVSIGGSIVAILASLYASKVSSSFGKIMRTNIFSKVEGFSLQEFDKLGTASLITRTTNDINQVQQVLLMMLRMMLMAPMMCIGGLILAFSKDSQLSLVLLVALPVLAVTILIIVSKGMPYFKIMQKKLDRINLVLREGLTGIRVIRAFNRTGYEQERFTEASSDLTNTAIKVNQIMAFMMPLMMLIMNFCTIGIVWFASKRIDMGEMQVGDMMAFTQYAMQIMFSLVMMSMMFVMLPRAQASAVRINEVMETEATVTNEAYNRSAQEEQNTLQDQQGVLAFQDVTFMYPGAEQAAVSNITFSVKPGEVTAIIGGTGSGKSTIINLIERFFDANHGSVSYEGVDIKQWDINELRQQMALVPQKATIFSGTVAENIRNGKEDATDEEILEAASIAQAAGFIEKMEQGYHTLLAQGGTNISGGQKQRLSIARALVRKPKLYLFDDSFSALDYKTDALLRAALNEKVKDAAMIIVAQRVSTVRHANQIIVLDEGRIAGIGTHEQLLETSDIYREIVQSQLTEEASA